jgi:hypothetical protein
MREVERSSSKSIFYEQPTPLPAARAWGGAWLLAVAAALLPLWEALEEHSFLSAAASLGMSSGAPLPIWVLRYLLFGGAIIFLVLRWARTEPALLPWLAGALALWTAFYALRTIEKTACTRSHAIDLWNVCERPGQYASGHPAYLSPLEHPITHGGPHLDNGDPCIHDDEHREVHQHEHPDGDLGDGLAQIWTRFPDDRTWLFGGTLASLLALVGGSLVLFLRPKALRPGAEG